MGNAARPGVGSGDLGERDLPESESGFPTTGGCCDGKKKYHGWYLVQGRDPTLQIPVSFRAS